MTFDTTTPLLEIVLRLGLAVVFGAMLGFDRELRGKPAGLRTHMLVALGAAATTLVALELYDKIMARHPDSGADPLRAIGGVITAIGFLGAGAIIRGDEQVRGLTTAANIWLCGTVGLACGGGHYFIAGATLGLTLLILTVVRVAEGWLHKALDD